MLVSAFIDPGEYRKTKTNVEPKITELKQDSIAVGKGFLF